MNDSVADSIDAASKTVLNIGEDVLVFDYYTANGQRCEGCIEEWIGNPSFMGDSQTEFEYRGRTFLEIGNSGGGADKLLVRDDATICYLNDLDCSISEVASNVAEFLSILRIPQELKEPDHT